eukprot:gene40764-50440_t
MGAWTRQKEELKSDVFKRMQKLRTLETCIVTMRHVALDWTQFMSSFAVSMTSNLRMTMRGVRTDPGEAVKRGTVTEIVMKALATYFKRLPIEFRFELQPSAAHRQQQVARVSVPATKSNLG